MALVPMNLRLEAPDGSGVAEYRVRDGDIEVRQLHHRADEWQFEQSWKPLSSAELAEHVQKNTIVAQWLKHRIGWRRLVLACTDKETLHRFGIEQTAVDRHAA